MGACGKRIYVRAAEVSATPSNNGMHPTAYQQTLMQDLLQIILKARRVMPLR